MEIKNICQEGKTILLSCAAAETIVNPVASYVFKTPQKDSDAATQWIYQHDEGQGHHHDRRDHQQRRLRQRPARPSWRSSPRRTASRSLITEVYDKEATDLTGVLTKVKGQDVQAVVNWSIVPAQTLVAKNMKQIGLNVPLFQSHGFGNIKYVQAGGEAAERHRLPLRPPAGRRRRCPTTTRRRRC